MIDFVQHFVAFLLGAVVAYVVLQIILTYFAIRSFKAELEKHIESRIIPVTVEFDNNQYYCYNKQSREFMAQGATLDEIKKRLQARFHDCIIYIDDGDPEVIDNLLRQK